MCTDIQNYITISTIFVIPYRIGLHKIYAPVYVHLSVHLHGSLKFRQLLADCPLGQA